MSFSYQFIYKTSRLYAQNMISGRNEGGGVDGYAADLRHVGWSYICMY